MIRLSELEVGESGEVCWLAKRLPSDFSIISGKTILKIADGLIKCENKTYIISDGCDFYIGVMKKSAL